MDRLADPENPKIKKKNQLIRSSIYNEIKSKRPRTTLPSQRKLQITYKTRVKIMMNRKNKE